MNKKKFLVLLTSTILLTLTLLPQSLTAAPQYPVDSIQLIGEVIVRDWSPDGTRLLGERLDGNTYQVYTMKPDGTDMVNLTLPAVPGGPAANCHKGFAHYDPTGRYVVMSVEMNFNCPKTNSNPGSGASMNVWVLDLVTGEWTNLTNYPLPTAGNPVGVLTPYFSHDGNKMLWVKLVAAATATNRLGKWELHLADFSTVGGPNLQNDTVLLGPASDRAFYESHGFSADDSKVLFSADIGMANGTDVFGLDVWSYEISNGALTNLTNLPEEYDEHAQYSPDGSKIIWGSSLCCSAYNKNYFLNTLQSEAHIMNADGTTVRQITNFNTSGFPESTPGRTGGWPTTWSLDGKQIVVAQQFYDGTHPRSWLVTLGNEPPSVVPAEFEDLYNSLDQDLDSFHTRIDSEWDEQKAPVAFSTELLTANSNAGTQLLDPLALDLLRLELERFRTLGIKMVSISLQFPLFSQSYHDWLGTGQYQQFIDFYKQVMVEIRLRNMKVRIESQTMFGTTYSDTALKVEEYYPTLSFAQYQAGRSETINTIARELKPDFLSVSSEPDTEAELSGFPISNPTDYTNMVRFFLSELQSVDTRGITIGAGLGTWQNRANEFVTNFGGLADLDYINFHHYPINNTFPHTFTNKLFSLLDTAISMGKKVAIGEAWLLKSRGSELGTGSLATDPVIFARDTFSFWQPLDGKFISAMVKFAHLKKLMYISHFWSRYFHAYLEYEDVKDDAPGDILVAGNQAARTAMLNGTFTGTGVAFGLLTAGPNVMITAPSKESTVSGVVTISGTAWDTQPLTSVQFMVDDSNIGDAITSPPYEMSWDSTASADGVHVLTALVRNETNALTISPPIVVTVDNSQTPPTTKMNVTKTYNGEDPNNPGTPDPDAAILSIESNDSLFTEATADATIPLPSGDLQITLTRISENPYIYTSPLSGSDYDDDEITQLIGQTLTLTMSGEPVDTLIQTGRILPTHGGKAFGPGGQAAVIIQPGDIDQPATITITPEPSDGLESRKAAMERQNLIPLGSGREITLQTSGKLEAATLILPYDQKLIPVDQKISQAKIAFYNPGTQEWEINENVELSGDLIQTEVTHFSFYQPVLVLPAQPAVSMTGYSYPNPAVSPKNPTLRAFVGIVDRLEIDIYDSSGQKVHSTTLEGEPTGKENQESFYEYVWDGEKASGTHIAVMKGKSHNGDVEVKFKFAVVR